MYCVINYSFIIFAPGFWTIIDKYYIFKLYRHLWQVT